MKIIVSFLFGLLLFTFTNTNLYAQNNEITIILLRHAEKDMTDEFNKYDPELAPEGKQRAERLVETIKKYKPEYIYSTNFKRTLATVNPLAEKIHPRYRLQVQKYDPAKLEDFANQLLKLKGRTIVVAGHNTTTPKLANILIKQDKYKALKEDEYNKIWIVKIKGKKIMETVIEY